MLPNKINPLGISKDLGPDIFQWKISITDAPQTFTAYINNIKHVIDWGDGTSFEGNALSASHEYTENGIYIISLTNTSGKANTKFRIFGDTPNLVIDCNYKWNSLGDVRWIQFIYGNSSSYNGRTCTKLPETLTSMETCFGYPNNTSCFISKIPDGVTNLATCGNVNSKAIFNIKKLPANITSLYRCFRFISSKSSIDIGKIVENAPENGFQQLVNIIGFCNCNSSDNYVKNGTVAKFMNKCPNATSIKASSETESPFYGSAVLQLFGDDDHYECTVNISEDNFTWGFTPISKQNGGTWYLIQWGDSTDVSPTSPYKTRYSLFNFTSETKIEHTYAKAGTYTIKLCTNVSEIVFDSIISDNQQYQFLGNPIISINN